MPQLLDMVAYRLPDEAVLFDDALSGIIEEAMALAGYEEKTEADLTTLQKGLVADLAAKALILPAMSKYKKDLASAEGDGSGKAQFVDKLKFLKEMETRLQASITEKRSQIDGAADPSAPMIVVEDV